MKIALDATPLTVPTGGVRRYTEELSRALAKNFPDDEFWLLSDQSFEPPCCAPPNLKAGRGPSNSLERRWWLWGLRRETTRLGIDVFHGTDFAVPYFPASPSVMTIHDLSPWMDRAWHTEARRVRSRTPLLLRLGRTTLIITPSETVKRQAIEKFRLDSNSVFTIPLGASALFRPAGAGAAEQPYFLYVGTLEPRKNLGFLRDVWREARGASPVQLVLAGRRRLDFPELPSEPGLRFTGPVPDEELPALYSGALACLYPSCYEGFGLPVLEAMQCGALVIASQDPSIAEVAGDAAILLPLSDRRAWVETLRTVAAQPDRIQALRRKAIARAAAFSWDNTAKLTREVYAHAAERFRKKA